MSSDDIEAFQRAARKGTLAEMVALMDGIDINSPDPRTGSTALHDAVQANSLPKVKALLKAGAIIDPEDNSGLTPLAIARAQKFRDVKRFLKKNYKGKLFIRVEDGKHVNWHRGAAKDRDIFIKVLHHNRTLRTQKVSAKTDPGWEKTFEININVAEDLEDKKDKHFRISIENNIETIAFCFVKVSKLRSEKAITRWYRMQSEYEESAGEVRVRMLYSRTIKDKDSLIGVWFNISEEDLMSVVESFAHWNRTRVMIVGKGRSGKSCVFNSLQGKAFNPDSDSTILAQVVQDLEITDYKQRGFDILKKRDKTGSAFTRTLASGIRRMSTSSKSPTFHHEVKLDGIGDPWQIVDGAGGPLSKNPSNVGTPVASDRNGLIGSDENKSVPVAESLQNLAQEEKMDEKDTKTRHKVASSRPQVDPSDYIPKRRTTFGYRSSVSGRYRASLSESYRKSASSLRSTKGTGSHTSTLKDIRPLELENELKNEGMMLNMWDFAGQEVFYTSHVVFLERNCVYLLVFSLEEFFASTERRTAAMDFIRFFLLSIKAYAHGATFIVVGTHRDTIEKRYGTGEKLAGKLRECDHALIKIVNQVFEGDFEGTEAICKWSYVDGKKKRVSLHFIPVNNMLGHLDKGIKYLLSRIKHAITQDEVANEEVPLRWTKVCDVLAGQKDNWMTFDGVAKIASDYGIETIREVKMMLAKFHQLGVVIYFNEDGLDQHVVLKPSFLIGYIRKIIYDKNIHFEVEEKKRALELGELWERFSAKGLLHQRVRKYLWKDVGKKRILDRRGKGAAERKFVLDLLRKFMLLADFSNEEHIAISMLPRAPESKIRRTSQKSISSNSSGVKPTLQVTATFSIQFEGFVPHSFFEMLICRLIQYLRSPQAKKDLKMQTASLQLNEKSLSLSESLIRFGDLHFCLIAPEPISKEEYSSHSKLSALSKPSATTDSPHMVELEEQKEKLEKKAATIVSRGRKFKPAGSIIVEVFSMSDESIGLVRKIMKDTAISICRWPFGNRLRFEVV